MQSRKSLEVVTVNRIKSSTRSSVDVNHVVGPCAYTYAVFVNVAGSYVALHAIARSLLFQQCPHVVPYEAKAFYIMATQRKRTIYIQCTCRQRKLQQPNVIRGHHIYKWTPVDTNELGTRPRRLTCTRHSEFETWHLLLYVV